MTYTPRTQAERNRAYRARIKARGMKIHQVIAPDNEHAANALLLCAAELKYLDDHGGLTTPVRVNVTRSN